MKAVDKTIELKEDYPEAWCSKGLILSDLDNDEGALKALEKAIEYDKEYIPAYHFLVEIYLSHTAIVKASEYIEKALKIEQENSELWFLRGRIKIEEQEYDDAIDSFNKAISLGIDKKELFFWKTYVKYLRAELYYSSNKARYQDAIISIIRDMEKVLDLNIKPELEAYAYYFLGFFYYKINDFYSAKDKLGKCLNLKPEIIKKDVSKDDSLVYLCESSEELLSKIWDYHLKPHWWTWWLKSPVNSERRKWTFIIILGTILTLFLNQLTLTLFLNQLSITYPFLDINWNIYLLFIIFLIFILVSPSITRIRGTDIEIEMQRPPKIELSPAKIGDLVTRIEEEDYTSRKIKW